MKQRCKRIWAAMAVCILTASLAGCSTIPKSKLHEPETSTDPEVSTVDEAPQTFSLSFSNEDTLNPFATKTRSNLDLAPLLYEGLTVIDNQLTPQLSLAASISNADPLNPVVTLRSDAKFSDGSAVTTGDVAGSFALAKVSENYSILLQNVKAATASTGANKTVTFNLESTDVNFQACLSFPIIKISTVTTEAAAAPMGSGRYVWNGGEAPTLTLSSQHTEQATISTIYLKHLPDDNAMLYGLETGTVQYYFSDMTEGKIPRTTSASTDVPLNYLCFMGINTTKVGLSDALVRQAISSAVSRTELAESAYSGHAKPATLPFHPLWSSTVGLTGFSANENITSAVAQLTMAGYNTISEESAVGKQKTLSLELLVNQDNGFRLAAANLIKTQLEKMGIGITVTTVSFSDYTARLKNNQFDLYLGEIRLPADMSLRPLLTKNGTASWGVQTEGAAATAYAKYLSGAQTLSEFVTAFVSDVPYIPLCWQNGIAAYDRSMSQVTPTSFNLFYGIENWSMKQ